ncbi:MAG: ABC transporter ATP-binding protein, partial [Solobacterium sp.]|nr:ABC transporter ATP-binding protein [Solobacterium sp.]
MSKEKFPTKLSMIWHFLRGSKVYFGLSILFACLVSLLELINPRIIAFTVDAVIDHKDVVLPEGIQNCVDTVGGIAFLRHNLWVIAIVVVIVALLAVSCRYFFQSFTAMGSERLVKTMRDDLFTHIMHLPFKWHSENHTGDIIQRCTSDVD